MKNLKIGTVASCLVAGWGGYAEAVAEVVEVFGKLKWKVVVQQCRGKGGKELYNTVVIHDCENESFILV